MSLVRLNITIPTTTIRTNYCIQDLLLLPTTETIKRQLNRHKIPVPCYVSQQSIVWKEECNEGRRDYDRKQPKLFQFSSKFLTFIIDFHNL